MRHDNIAAFGQFESKRDKLGAAIRGRGVGRPARGSLANTGLEPGRARLRLRAAAQAAPTLYSYRKEP